MNKIALHAMWLTLIIILLSLTVLVNSSTPIFIAALIAYGVAYSIIILHESQKGHTNKTNIGPLQSYDNRYVTECKDLSKYWLVDNHNRKYEILDEYTIKPIKNERYNDGFYYDYITNTITVTVKDLLKYHHYSFSLEPKSAIRKRRINNETIRS